MSLYEHFRLGSLFRRFAAIIMTSASRPAAIRFGEREFELPFLPSLEMIWGQNRRQRRCINAGFLAPEPATVSAPGSRVVDPLMTSIRTIPGGRPVRLASHISFWDLRIARRHQSCRGARAGSDVHRTPVKAVIMRGSSNVDRLLLLGTECIRCVHRGKLRRLRVFRVSRRAQCRSARPQSRKGLAGRAIAIVPAIIG